MPAYLTEGGGVLRFAADEEPGDVFAGMIRRGELVPMPETPSSSPATGESDGETGDETGEGETGETEGETGETPAAPVSVLPKPAGTDNKGAWVEYAVSTGEISHSAAQALSRPKLIERFG